MNIGIAIKRLRMRKGLSQQEFAKLCGFRQSYLSTYESGLNKPSSAALKKITDCLEVPEILIYMLSVEINDIPEDKREEFERIFPEMQRVLLALFQ